MGAGSSDAIFQGSVLPARAANALSDPTPPQLLEMLQSAIDAIESRRSGG